MAKTRKVQSIDAGKIESPIVAPNEEVQREFAEAAQLGSAGRQHMLDKLREHHSTSPKLSGGDVDAAWEDADVGEESVGGENPTPDQDIAEELGKAVGLSYQDNEPLHTNEKIAARDKSRWELDPASSEGYEERMKHEGEYEEKWGLASQITGSHPSEVTDQRSFENSPQVESLSAIERRLRWNMNRFCFEDDLVFPLCKV